LHHRSVNNHKNRQEEAFIYGHFDLRNATYIGGENNDLIE